MSRNETVSSRWLRAAALLAVFAATAALAQPPANSSPVGVFDSGTGGLAVLEQILTLDLFDNRSHAFAEKGDGRPDFQDERFVFLADQANMPYGNYPVVGKERFLVELVENDARFLLSDQYFASPSATGPSTGRRPAKAIVIACNTATAYGKSAIESLVASGGSNCEVIGVIEAAARGAIEAFRQTPAGTIGVLATEGTVASGAYPKTIQQFALRMGQRGEVRVVQQPAYGLAGAVDGIREFIVRDPADGRPRPDYRGPSLAPRGDCPPASTGDCPPAFQFTIDRGLLPRYGFDFSAHGMLCDGDRADPRVLQINSVENYIAYHLVSLLEQIRTSPDPRPLTVLVLGCTHFPFYAETIRARLAWLYDYREHDQYVYRPCLAAEVKLIDPALYVGRDLYERLVRRGQLAESATLAATEPRAEFYITVPWPEYPGVRLDAGGWFTYDYKYGRSPGGALCDFRAVPWAEGRVDAEVADRLARQTPAVWDLIRRFSAAR